MVNPTQRPGTAAFAAGYRVERRHEGWRVFLPDGEMVRNASYEGERDAWIAADARVEMLQETPMIEIRRTCVLAMSRLTDATVKMLTATPLGDWPIMGAPMGDAMLMFWAPTEMPEGVPSDLRDALAWARRQMPPGATPNDPGFEYVLFDRDVDPVEDGCEMPIYGYDAPGAPPSPETILRELINRAQAYYHRKIEKPEACPDGDMFNDLFGMIEEAEAALGEIS